MPQPRIPLAVIAACLAAGLAACAVGPVQGDARGPDDDEERPYADFYHTTGTVQAIPVLGRMVLEEGAVDITRAVPWDQVTEDEIDDAEVALAVVDEAGETVLDLGALVADDEGWIHTRVEVPEGKLAPGVHRIAIRHAGAVAGHTRARLLGLDHEGLVVRSDVDLTYLDTNFHDGSAMLGLLRQDATERATLPAMERVYAALRDGDAARGPRPITFVSGSPRFFKRVLEGRMKLDRVEHDGLALKPFKDIAAAHLLKHLGVGGLVDALKEQVGYKLTWLFEARLELPPRAPELLMGDDSEADFIVYALYHRFTSRQITKADLMRELATLGVDESWRRRIRPAADRILALLPEGFAPVRGIYINRTARPSEDHAIDDWRIDGLTRPHRGAWPLVLDLHEEGIVAERAVREVKARLRLLGQTEEALREAADAAVKDGFLDAKTASAF